MNLSEQPTVWVIYNTGDYRWSHIGIHATKAGAEAGLERYLAENAENGVIAADYEIHPERLGA